MYQMFIGCRIIAQGYPLVGSDMVAIRKDIQLPGEQVDSYARRPRLHPCPIVERHLPLADMGRVVADAVEPYVVSSEKQKIVERILRQLLAFPYVYWMVEYRRMQSWKYGIGIALGMRLKNIACGLALNPLCRLRLSIVYWTVTMIGLSVPIAFFRSVYPLLYSFSKSRYASRSVRSIQY